MKDNIKSSDRVLVLKAIEGTKPVSSTGLLDGRLFKGGNTLHTVMDPQTTLWNLKYEQGALPEDLKGKFTSFGKALKVAEDYFIKRNLEVVEVKD